MIPVGLELLPTNREYEFVFTTLFGLDNSGEPEVKIIIKDPGKCGHWVEAFIKDSGVWLDGIFKLKDVITKDLSEIAE